MFKRILIPLDGSLLAERSIPHAEQFARIFGSSIVLLRVLEVASDPENQTPTNPLTWQIHKAEAELYLHGIAARIREHLQLPEQDDDRGTSKGASVEYAIREGRTAEKILEFAHNENIDLLVISSHGSGGISRWNMSSIIQKVIDQIYLPLLIVRSNDMHDLQEDISSRIHYRHILVPIDSSRRAECALSAGIILVQGEQYLERSLAAVQLETDQPSPERIEPVRVSPEIKLILGAVIKPPEIPIPKPYPVKVGKLSDQLLKVSRDAVQSYLIKMKLRLPVESEIRVVESSNVSAAIQELSVDEDIDLILMSAHGNTDQFSQPYGNATRNTMEHGTKSVLVIQDMPRSQGRFSEVKVKEEKSGRYVISQDDRSKSLIEESGFASTPDKLLV